MQRGYETKRKNQIKQSKKNKQTAKLKRLKLGLKAVDVAEYLGITIQSFIGKEKGEQPWRWGEIKKLIKLYDIKSIDELLRTF